jgi:ribonuclease HI
MVEAYFDGACWPNPGGPAGAGALVKRGGINIYEGDEFLAPTKSMSNNVAEYSGLILVLKFLVENGITEATIYGDSNLVIKQMSGEWQVKKPSDNKPRYYFPFAKEALSIAKKLPKLKYQWIPRELNGEADALSNKPLIERGIRNPYDK